ncbi:thioredoxin family protein [Plebeiibacterium marinum]|uniref:Thioredoxin domain-containing protein n=1 Tax=Plebeiibacterium marinum TaxID=2992111 RepID=A0AAE3MCX4_9BACT|nr:thioredoxin domain-containing protein [Plebeiobacterium marinum]MCW3805541.1 thioredoxin domain-containing protein [Plebeiobacterium marinum]
MKKIIFFLAVILVNTAGLFAQGIEFTHATFSEALSKAKTENKMVFMDCYTSWCGPCKMLAKNVFPLKEVGDYFNQRFVCVKMDMEKGEGIELAKKYGVKAYPTLLFLDADGKVLHTKVGGADGPGLIEQAKIASDPSKQIRALHKKYDEGERSVTFLSNYVKALANAYQMDKLAEVGEAFIKNTATEELLNVDAITIISYSGILKYGSQVFQFIIDNKDEYLSFDGIGEEDINGLLAGAINNYYGEVASGSSLNDLKSAIEATKKVHVSAYQDYLETNAYKTYYLSHKEYDNWFQFSIDQAEELMKTDKDQGTSMIIQSAFEVGVRPEFAEADDLAEKAAKYIEELIEKSDKEVLAGYFCLASLYKKLGDKEKALENINSYISISKEESPRVTKLKSEIEGM